MGIRQLNYGNDHVTLTGDTAELSEGVVKFSGWRVPERPGQPCCRLGFARLPAQPRPWPAACEHWRPPRAVSTPAGSSAAPGRRGADAARGVAAPPSPASPQPSRAWPQPSPPKGGPGGRAPQPRAGEGARPQPSCSAAPVRRTPRARGSTVVGEGAVLSAPSSAPGSCGRRGERGPQRDQGSGPGATGPGVRGGEEKTPQAGLLPSSRGHRPATASCPGSASPLQPEEKPHSALQLGRDRPPAGPRVPQPRTPAYRQAAPHGPSRSAARLPPLAFKLKFPGWGRRRPRRARSAPSRRKPLPQGRRTRPPARKPPRAGQRHAPAPRGAGLPHAACLEPGAGGAAPGRPAQARGPREPHRTACLEPWAPWETLWDSLPKPGASQEPLEDGLPRPRDPREPLRKACPKPGGPVGNTLGQPAPTPGTAPGRPAPHVWPHGNCSG
ncbi:translation initiation factor IF-2-like [Ochotona curzoniae]|uniref:translation initiation factor IF-2-like n=1 Tax=Ochotona curzoniae TaxID=130825 RepID=UPI001B34C015|nr:translation initiation factor IF-2-like [Ochotona curzoniae]